MTRVQNRQTSSPEIPPLMGSFIILLFFVLVIVYYIILFSHVNIKTVYRRYRLCFAAVVALPVVAVLAGYYYSAGSETRQP